MDFKFIPVTVKTEVAQSCPTLCNPVDCSPPGSSVHGILQARILEWVAISFSRGSSDPGVEPGSPTLEAHALTSKPPGKTVAPWQGSNSQLNPQHQTQWMPWHIGGAPEILGKWWLQIFGGTHLNHWWYFKKPPNPLSSSAYRTIDKHARTC